MILYRYLILFLLAFSASAVCAQQAVVEGNVYGQDQIPLRGAAVQVVNSSRSAVTDSLGYFRLPIPAGDSIRLLFSYLGYKPRLYYLNLAPGETRLLRAEMEAAEQLLREVEVKEDRQEIFRDQAGMSRLEPREIQHVPSPFNDISAALATLPGVRQNNELSSSYAVRGGNFDENLVYVNEIPVYRPFLIRAGQQEGLGFVNPAMVQNLSFSSGGWQAKWGDKLSSVLAIEYKKPDTTAFMVTAGLLGGAGQAEGTSKNKRLSYLAGFRHKSAQYLLNTLETEGEYLPSFSDFQSFITYKLSDKSELNLLTSYARNRYLTEPQSRQTTFGTQEQAFQLNVGFEGQELLTYDMYQNALKLTTRWNKKLRSSWIASYLHTVEREYADVEGGYYLCNLNVGPDSPEYNECLNNLGLGTSYLNIRNLLKAYILNIQSRNEWKFSPGHVMEFGLQLGYENINDRLREWGFSDSADFVTIESQRLITNDIAIKNQRLEGYVQNTSSLGAGRHTLHYGLRLHYFSMNRQLLLSPRLQYSYRPAWLNDVVFTSAIGLYHQPPLYREFRSFSGEIRPGVLAQSSLHITAGADLNFRMWGRPFNFVTEVYYKDLWNVNAYDVDNVRIRYFADNNTKAYATGADFRLSGEFISGAESWFSLGLLKTEEDVQGDGQGYIPRPSDQRVNLGIFFQDHFINDPTYRVYVKLLYGSGLPFGPPGNIQYRNSFTGRSYRRVDVGFSKILTPRLWKIKNLWAGLEVLNLLGNHNVISYSWVSDYNNLQYAVPNALSARFVNLKLVVNW